MLSLKRRNAMTEALERRISYSHAALAKRFQLHGEQREPPGTWKAWLILAVRRWGKTFALSSWVNQIAFEGRPNKQGIALVGASPGHVVHEMIMGPAGIYTIASDDFKPTLDPLKKRLTWPNGEWARFYNSDEWEDMRGKQHAFAACDALESWRHRKETIGQVGFGTRLGEARVMVTASPPEGRDDELAEMLYPIAIDPQSTVVLDEAGCAFLNRGTASLVATIKWADELAPLTQDSFLAAAEIARRDMTPARFRDELLNDFEPRAPGLGPSLTHVWYDAWPSSTGVFSEPELDGDGFARVVRAVFAREAPRAVVSVDATRDWHLARIRLIDQDASMSVPRRYIGTESYVTREATTLARRMVRELGEKQAGVVSK